MKNGPISIRELPDISKEHWFKMSPPKSFIKTEHWMTNWLLYGINRGWIDVDDIVKVLEVINNGNEKS